MIVEHDAAAEARAVLPAVRTMRWVRHGLGRVGSQRALLGITLAWTTITFLGLLTYPELVPWSALIGVAVFAGLFLAPRNLTIAYVVLVVSMIAARLVVDATKPSFLGAFVVLVAVMALMFWVARSRARIGTQGIGGDTILVDLRDRLGQMGELPELPHGWAAESAVHSAHGDSFSGDFVVASLHAESQRLEVAVVDVSGKGTRAGTRALLLSGAFGGLLSAVAAEDFLTAANRFLGRQRWREGFATAVHVALDLETGAYSVGSAGHPPALHLCASSGGWKVLDTGGPPLGVVDDFRYRRVEGVLARGDALMLYTDGVIEARETDLDDGIDRLLGQAERGRAIGFSGLANHACRIARAGVSDDRATVVIWRE